MSKNKRKRERESVCVASYLKTSRGASTVATMSPTEGMLVMVVREIWMVQAKRRITSSMMAQ